MGYEIDFLPVGDGERSGDAICFRLGNLLGPREEQFVVVVDGGFAKNGDAIVSHVRDVYKTNEVDVVVSTHPDDDHSCGLANVLENMVVGQLWMHKPWEHSKELAGLFKGTTVHSLNKKFKESLESARNLAEIANTYGVTVVEPFTGVSLGKSMFVIGPDRAYYQELLCQFDPAPELKPAVKSLLGGYLGPLAEAVKKKLEDWNIETLSDDCQTRAENDSSVILFVNAGEEYWLLTGDASIPALTRAMNLVDVHQIDQSRIKFVQVPHHGSHHSVGPTLLDRLVGPKLQNETVIKTAFCSAAKNSPKHPSKKVMNAFRRRGAPVHVTQGLIKSHGKDAPARPGYVDSVPLPFYPEVED